MRTFIHVITLKCLLNLLSFSSALKKPDTNLSVQVILWDNKPYAFKNEDDGIDGIFPEALSANACKDVNFEVKKRLLSTAEAFQLFQSNTPWDVLQQYNISINDTVMFGAHKQYLNTHNGFKDIYLGKSSTLVIMVARGRISLPQNLYRAITKSWVLLYLMFIYTLLSAFIIWFVEVWRNKSNFPSSFITGFANGIWWSTITMSTVGYGDIVPKSLLGRLLSIMWIWLSVLLIACMTSTITNSLSLPINLEEEKVAVLNNSWEHQVIKKIPEEISVEETYEDVLNKVSKDDYVGLMDYTRASRTQEEIREKNIRLLSSFSGQFDWVFQLSHNRTNVSVVEDCLERIGRHDIKTIFAEYTSVITYNKLDDGIESLETHTTFFMSSCIGGIFLLGCMYDIVRYILKKTKKRTAELNLNQSSALKLELAQIHLKKRIISLREELNDNLTELENMLDETTIK